MKKLGGSRKTVFNLFWLGVYIASTLIALLGSQLFGSNSATAVILGVHLITLMMSLIVRRQEIRQSYLANKLALPWSKRLVKKIIVTTILGLLFFFGLMGLIIFWSSFDITSTRLFGFGDGSNSSIQSRIDILINEGADQLSYAPFFGNINVAYHTTGYAGNTLHSFFPYRVANLGLVGLFIIIMLFSGIFLNLYHEAKSHRSVSVCAYQGSMIAIYSSFILLYLIFFANLATGVSWPVLWFSVGFVSKPFGFK